MVYLLALDLVVLLAYVFARDGVTLFQEVQNFAERFVLEGGMVGVAVDFGVLDHEFYVILLFQFVEYLFEGDIPEDGDAVDPGVVVIDITRAEGVGVVGLVVVQYFAGAHGNELLGDVVGYVYPAFVERDIEAALVGIGVDVESSAGGRDTDVVGVDDEGVLRVGIDLEEGFALNGTERDI